MKKLKTLMAVCLLTAVSHVPAQAGWSVLTRASCKALAKQYVARSHAGCKWDSYLCSNAGISCGTASSSCGPKSCGCGSGRASSYNGPSGYGGSITTTCNGRGGTFQPGEGNPRSSSSSNVAGRASFDRSGAAVLTIQRGRFAVTPDSTGVLNVRVWVAEGERDDEATEAKTIWGGRMVIRGGKVTFEGRLTAESFKVVESRQMIVVTVSNWTQRVPVPAKARENVVVEFSSDGGVAASETATPPARPLDELSTCAFPAGGPPRFDLWPSLASLTRM